MLRFKCHSNLEHYPIQRNPKEGKKKLLAEHKKENRKKLFILFLTSCLFISYYDIISPAIQRQRPASADLT